MDISHKQPVVLKWDTGPKAKCHVIKKKNRTALSL